jgi:hypothetical protein
MKTKIRKVMDKLEKQVTIKEQCNNTKHKREQYRIARYSA